MVSCLTQFTTIHHQHMFFPTCFNICFAYCCCYQWNAIGKWWSAGSTKWKQELKLQSADTPDSCQTVSRAACYCCGEVCCCFSPHTHQRQRRAKKKTANLTYGSVFYMVFSTLFDLNAFAALFWFCAVTKKERKILFLLHTITICVAVIILDPKSDKKSEQFALNNCRIRQEDALNHLRNTSKT